MKQVVSDFHWKNLLARRINRRAFLFRSLFHFPSEFSSRRVFPLRLRYLFPANYLSVRVFLPARVISHRRVFPFCIQSPFLPERHIFQVRPHFFFFLLPLLQLSSCARLLPAHTQTFPPTTPPTRHIYLIYPSSLSLPLPSSRARPPTLSLPRSSPYLPPHTHIHSFLSAFVNKTVNNIERRVIYLYKDFGLHLCRNPLICICSDLYGRAWVLQPL